MSGGADKPGYVMPGMAVGPYTVEGQIGSGGFGFVYRVKRDGRAYALKIAHTRLGDLRDEDRESTIERLDREIAALKSLRHPNIVRVHSFDRWPEMESGYPYLVMDLVDGTPLQEWIAVAAPSVARIVAAFEKVADALAHMHELGIIHRDLKSQNILVTAGGEPFIVDFGIARPRVAYDVTRAAGVGTLSHLTPEYVAYLDSAGAGSGAPFEWKPTTDLYALGFVLYEALTGKPPVPTFAEATAKAEAELLAAIKTGVPRRPREVEPNVPEGLDALVMELLEKDPARRPQDASQVLERLRATREAGVAAGDPAWVNPFDQDGQAAPGDPVDENVIDPIESPGPGDSTPGVRAPPQPQVPPTRPEVSLPTAERATPFADEGESGADDATRGPRAPDKWGSESQILRRAATEWGVATSKPRRWQLAAGAGAILAVLAFIFVAGRSADERPRPKTLLSAAEPGALPAAPAAAAPPIQQQLAMPSPSPANVSTSSSGERVPRRSIASAPAPLAAKGPTRAPAAEPSGILRSRPVGAEPDVLQTSRRLASTGGAAAAGSKLRGVPYGAHVQVRLLSSLDSRTIANGPVEAQLHVPYVVRGQVVLPTRTMVYGTASEAGGRFTVRFSRLRLPDDTEIPFEGIALARDDGKPGLAATGRVGQEPKRNSGVGSTIAKGTGNVLLDIIAGGTPQSVVRSAGVAALSHQEPQPAGGGGDWALLLDAGTVFDVFVEKAF